MGANDVFGFGRFAAMKADGFDHPIEMPMSNSWIYNYTQHPIYWLNAMFFITSGTKLTYGRLALVGSLFLYNFIGALIETWRFKDLQVESKDTKKSE
jgi:hypothetical protein